MRQTQYSDISVEKRSPKTTVKLSIKQHSNGRTIQPNSSQIIVNGLNKDKNNNNQNANNQLLSSNKSPNLKKTTSEPTEPVQSYKLNVDQSRISLNDNQDKISDISDEFKNSKKQDQFNFDSTQLTNVSKDNRNQVEYPKLEKLIQNELKKLNNKQLSHKLIRCNTTVEIDDYTSRPKITQNRKLIFNQTIG